MSDLIFNGPCSALKDLFIAIERSDPTCDPYNLLLSLNATRNAEDPSQCTVEMPSSYALIEEDAATQYEASELNRCLSGSSSLAWASTIRSAMYPSSDSFVSTRSTPSIASTESPWWQSAWAMVGGAAVLVGGAFLVGAYVAFSSLSRKHGVESLALQNTLKSLKDQVTALTQRAELAEGALEGESRLLTDVVKHTLGLEKEIESLRGKLNSLQEELALVEGRFKNSGLRLLDERIMASLTISKLATQRRVLTNSIDSLRTELAEAQQEIATLEAQLKKPNVIYIFTHSDSPSVSGVPDMSSSTFSIRPSLNGSGSSHQA